MCSLCRTEYTDPTDRRFHAQPTACPECGPALRIVDRRGQPIADDAIAKGRQMLLEGKIIAIKGLGGFHLAVRADDEPAVRRLSRLKQRDYKPFAVLMVSSIEAARTLVHLSEAAAKSALSPSCPIVLAHRCQGAAIAPSVAGASHRLGMMLPYTPVHHLLFARDPSLPPLVMTSGNVSDEPLVIDNEEAIDHLGPLCNALLLHDRPIKHGLDDSVVVDIGEADPIPVRRAARICSDCSSASLESQLHGLCVGADLKNTIAVVAKAGACGAASRE